MAQVDARAVMALHRLTDLPLSMCREALAEAGGDLAAVVRQLRGSPCRGLHLSDPEVARALAAAVGESRPAEPDAAADRGLTSR
jgi:translation elongation factor EF-Ts